MTGIGGKESQCLPVAPGLLARPLPLLETLLLDASTAAGGRVFLRGGVSQTPSLGTDLGQPHLLSPVNGAFLPQPDLFIFLPSPLVLPPELEKAENEALAMRKQSKGLTKEYDRLLEEHAKLQVSPSASGLTCLLDEALEASWLQSLPVALISSSAAPASASLGPNSQNSSLGKRAVVDGSHLARRPWLPGQPSALWAFPASCLASVPSRRDPFLPCTPGAQFGAPLTPVQVH